MNHNNWYVITGAPSSGKTTILEYLEKKKYTVFYEWARIYIDEQMKKGKTLEDIRGDESKFQRKVHELKINFEKKLNPTDTLFMERGLPDTKAYLEAQNVPVDVWIKDTVKRSRYKKVFLMELVEFKEDYARNESKELAFLLENLLEKSYKDLSIPIIRVPLLSVPKRVKFILKNL